MSVEDLFDENACGCCEVPISPTPVVIRNRPGLTAVRYRVGTFTTFRQAMIESIAKVDENGSRSLKDWTARTSDDYGVAVLEMWAYLADILTFYQERIANEAFLRTALLRESVLRLAALLGYEPAPGVAATTLLTFMLEEDKQVRIPIGLRVQSVPGQDERPQKFETVESASTTSRLNKVRIYPEPVPVNPFARTSTEAILEPANAASISSTVAPGDPFVLFDTRLRVIEEKQVNSLRTEDGHTRLSWSPEIRQRFPETLGTSHAFKVGRKLRIFGYNAPRRYLRPTPVGEFDEMRWVPVDNESDNGINHYRFEEAENTLSLDSRYDDLKPGTRLLLFAVDDDENIVQVLTISTIGQGQANLDPLSDTVTQITVRERLSSFDRRQAILYELSEPEIRFWGFEYPNEISDDVILAKTEDLGAESEVVAAIEHGQTLLLADGDGRTELVTIQAVEPVTVQRSSEPPTPDGAKYLRISFTPPLTHGLKSETAVLHGNVAMATHGETVAGEMLGSGDASTGFQSFQIDKSPVTFVSQPGASHGAANTLRVRVDSVLWHEVDALFGHEEDERVYTTLVDDKGSMTVQFGNGISGARLTTGRNNVVADYRQGIGREGNVKANTLTTLLDRPVGLKSVTNPEAAQGGAAPESLDEARTNAPNTVRTFGRVVSLRDFEDAAREFAGVAKAHATLTWDGTEQAVRLIVAGDEGIAISADSDIVTNLKKDLDSRRDPNRKLAVEPYVQVFVQVEAVIYVDPYFRDEDVRAAALAALLAFFAFDSLELGQSIHLSNVYEALQAVRGVVAVDIDRLQYKDAFVGATHGATDAPVQPHLPIFSKELASIEQPVDDAVVRVGTKR